jgi:predicted 3-demethylubiquinone-9 3-methyltransferase (glyoxalase superfamily)
MSNITTCLWFEKQAEEAANFYVKVFSGVDGHSGKIGRMVRYSESSSKASGQPEGSVLTIEFELDGSKFIGLNGGPMFKFSGATSFIIDCKTQEEVDYFWAKLGEGGQTGQCGWINYDKFGLTWQVVPAVLDELLSDPDKEKAERAMKAMLEMTKLDIAALKKAAQ